MKLEAYTDAGFKDGVSTHHWRIITETGWNTKRRSFKGSETDSNKAELQSIISLVQYLNKKDMIGVTIYTDSQYVVNLLNGNNESDESNLVKSLKWDLKWLKSEVKWVSRKTKQIKLADHYCSQLMDTVFKRKEYQELMIQ